MSGFGDEVMVRARLALGGASSLPDELAYRKWIEHQCDLLHHLAVWVAQYPTDNPKTQAEALSIMPELGAAHLRLQKMLPTIYAKWRFKKWQDFVLWCREHPQYTAEGALIEYAPPED